MTLRRATAADAEALADVFASAVRAAGPAGYTPEQVEAWAAAADDRATFGRRVLQASVILAEEGGAPIGFGALGEGGHVAMLYVRGGRQRRGVGRVLLDAVLAEAMARGERRAHAEASAFSLPLFLDAGFRVTGVETVERRGVRFQRTLVQRALGPS